MDYWEYSVAAGSEPVGEVVVALLCDLGFESFMWDERGAQLCYIPSIAHAEFAAEIKEVLTAAGHNFTAKLIVAENWNAQWESDFAPIVVGQSVCVRTPNHPTSDCTHEVLIVPNMSFGTGHHPTTYMMLEALSLLGCEGVTGRHVADIGCGSGVLGIYCWQLGAGHVVGVDIDEWSVQSATENVQLNSAAMQVITGDVAVLAGHSYDIILANINRNVLLDNIGQYAAMLSPGGRLLLSGFYLVDVAVLVESAAGFGLVLEGQNQREGWSQLTFRH